MGRLDGRLAVVTGASRGIGKAIATAFVREGARVVLVSRRQESLDAVVAELGGAQVWARALHVGTVDAIPAWWDALQAEVGTPDILINNAGTNPHFGPLIEADWPAWHKTFQVNVEGPFEMTRQLVKRHLAGGAGRPASVVFVTSVLAERAAALQGVYGATKAALASLTRTLAVELGETGIRFNAIAPGFVETKLSGAIHADPVLRAKALDHTALRRIAKPDEIAGLAVWLASEESSYATGQTYLLDGGYTVV
jgi:NAD(P)-dependent dehydrogenase (short-subunit alcohol dehydrogenase family)